MTLPEKLLAIHRSLFDAGLGHAFGGAIALAYWTLDPRGTSDIDVNVFVPATRAEDAFRSLPEEVAYGPDDVVAAGRDRQVRLWWAGTPVDLFFDYVPLHASAADNLRMVPFEDAEIPVLGPVELAVFKAMFDRTRDWADIESMFAAETLDMDAVRAGLVALVGDRDPRLDRLEEALRRAAR